MKKTENKQVLNRSWDGRPFGHNRHGPERGGLLCPFPGWERSPKKWDAEKKRSSREVLVVNPQAGRESILGKLCERGMFWAGSERLRELWMVRVVSQRRENMWLEQEKVSQRKDRPVWGWWREVGSWFQRQNRWVCVKVSCSSFNFNFKVFFPLSFYFLWFFVMVALCNRADYYIFALWFLPLFFLA